MLANPLHPLLATLLFVSTVLTVLVASRFIGFNSTPSAAPVGFYWRTAPRPGRGKMVEFCLPEDVAELALARGYIGHGSCPGDAESLGKIVAGMPGDIVTVDPAAVLRTDSAGRPMEHFPFGRYRVPAGQVWVHGTAPNSFDSRYFGSVPISNIKASLEPLLTW
jgi:conjugative transfer signal peptidase TraF